MDQRRLWNNAYESGDERRSWYQAHPARSLTAIQAVAPSPQEAIIDVGGGSSRLAGALIVAGYSDVTVLDISDTALSLARDRLGADADRIAWLAADLRTWQPARRYDVWHDRAVLHFFIDPADRRAYTNVLRAALSSRGHAVIATFAPDGPEQCSGLPVQRNSEDEILELLGRDFISVSTSRETHMTPSGGEQAFTWVIARRRPR